MALRDGLRSGDVHVPGSRRYADPASFLLTPQQWEPQRLEFCHLVGKPATAADALALANDELHAALSDLEAQLARGGGKGEVRLGPDGELIIPPLTAEDVPADAEALREELGAMLPRVPIASVLVEIDARTGFIDQLTHAGGRATRPPELRRNLLYVIIAEATNMGLSCVGVVRRLVRHAGLKPSGTSAGDAGGGQRRPQLRGGGSLVAGVGGSPRHSRRCFPACRPDHGFRAAGHEADRVAAGRARAAIASAQPAHPVAVVVDPEAEPPCVVFPAHPVGGTLRGDRFGEHPGAQQAARRKGVIKARHRPGRFRGR